MKETIALIGGRGYVGEALLRLIVEHPHLELAWVSSRSLAGKSIRSVYPDCPWDLAFESVRPEALPGRPAGVIVLALPNRLAGPYVERLAPDQRVLDLSADYRFDSEWAYGLPELSRAKLHGAARVSNPGCYATAMQLGLAPLANAFDKPPVAFGVSGYSGAGRTPSARNAPDRLKDNLQPYSLSGHMHELEVSQQLGQQVCFLPHVAPFFRGISVTVSAQLKEKTNAEELLRLFQAHYADEPLIGISHDIPEIRNVANTPAASIGGFAVDQRDGRHISLVVCIDNLLKGAASQAMQNINLMLGFDELDGIAIAPD